MTEDRTDYQKGYDDGFARGVEEGKKLASPCYVPLVPPVSPFIPSTDPWQPHRDYWRWNDPNDPIITPATEPLRWHPVKYEVTCKTDATPC